jgi:hypothetical protein
MFKITMRAGGISSNVGPTAAEDIEKEFREHRAWHKSVSCSFADGTLTLVAFNDYDHDGLALSDEFSDCLTAYVAQEDMSDDGEFGVVTVETI